MQKRIFHLYAVSVLLIIALIISVLQFADKPKTQKQVIAVVDGVEIYKENIDFMLKLNEISKENSPQQTIDDDIQQSEVVDQQQLLNKRIRSIVIYNEAKKLGLEADYDEAYQTAKGAYDIAKEANDENYALIVDYMERIKFSEEEYLELAAKTYQNIMTQSNLYNEFIKDKSGTEDELKALFEEYVERLIEQAEIEYK
ncbi:MAG: hypothetical protein E7562_05095 [Ruminococcaceae bacterium]|nr:hypothetical protein [Oscillospiraceae bacterium]